MKKLFFFLIMCIGLLELVYSQTQNFDASRAFGFLEKQCNYGPRTPGSDGHKLCLEYLTNELKKVAETVEKQHFFYTVPLTNQSLRGTNVIGKFNLANPTRVVLCAHWDTRPKADMDPNPENHNQPVMGANDGASGVAVLLEIAQHLKQKSPPYGVDIVFFDAEDAGLYQNHSSWAIGSKIYANKIPRENMPKFGILLDMIGDQNLEVFQEINSVQNSPRLVKYVWDIASEIGVNEFYSKQGYMVSDDHLSLLSVGIPCIDIIDFDYPQWHTVQDTPENCSPESLEKIGRVILEVIYRGEF